MKTISTALISLFGACLLWMLWYMFFIMEIPFEVGDASGEFWYEHSYWGLLAASLINLVTSGIIVVGGAYAFIKGRAMASRVERAVPRLLALCAVCTAYGLYILGSFIFITCAC